jgi:hypothetical protein
LRVIELLPTRLVGVIADHGDFPIERIAVDRSGEGRWVGSAGHDEVLRLTDLREVLEDEDERGAEEEERDGDGDASRDEDDEGARPGLRLAKGGTPDEEGGAEQEQESGDESDVPKPRKRRKKEKGDLTGRPLRKQVDIDPSFFSGL